MWHTDRWRDEQRDKWERNKLYMSSDMHKKFFFSWDLVCLCFNQSLPCLWQSERWLILWSRLCAVLENNMQKTLQLLHCTISYQTLPPDQNLTFRKCMLIGFLWNLTMFYCFSWQIFQAVPRELGITRHLCEQYLSMLADDSVSDMPFPEHV